MPGRESFVQARDNLARAREEAKARFHEWAALLAKEAAEDALVVVIQDEGLTRPATDEVAPLVSAAFGDVPVDHVVMADALRLDEIHEPVEVDLETASLAEREGGKADYVDAAAAKEAIERAAAIVEACEAAVEA